MNIFKKFIDLANRKRNATAVVVEAGVEAQKQQVSEMIPECDRKNHEECVIHMHDYENYHITYNCIGLHVYDLVKKGGCTFAEMLRRIVRGISEVTNNQSGGIGFIDFDNEAAEFLADENDRELVSDIREFLLDLNMNLRRGCEVAYVTFNIGLASSEKARRVAFALLKAYEQGDDNGNPLIFPNLVFKLKETVNVAKESPNYDLTVMAQAVAAKRMVPTFFNCDNAENKAFDSSSIGIMGCRTRIASNVNGEKGAFNRGNVAGVTINLPQLAWLSKGSIEKFYELIDTKMSESLESLRRRYETLCKLGDFSYLYKNGIYRDAQSGDADKMFKNGTLSIGFIGLWDAIATLHNCEFTTEDDISNHYSEGYDLIKHMRKMTDEMTARTHMNISLLATAAEGVTGKFAKHDAASYGEGFKACQKGFYTNSFHIPVDIEIDFAQKIKLEAPFHLLCNGGCITYVELEEMPNNNVEAVQEIVEEAFYAGCNYFGINFPLDNCLDCGFTGRINCDCPSCHSHNLRRLRRVSGYLADADRFTSGKKKELSKRIPHLEKVDFTDMKKVQL